MNAKDIEIVPYAGGGLVATAGRRLGIAENLLAQFGMDIFRVPHDGTIYEAVEQVKAGGTIFLAAGKYEIFEILHIKKPLAIIGEGKNNSVFSSDSVRLGHFITVNHDEELLLKDLTLCNTCKYSYGNIISISCSAAVIENCKFIGAIPHKPSGCYRKSSTLAITGKTSCTILNNAFIDIGIGVALYESASSKIENNVFKNNIIGIGYFDHSFGTAINNIIETCREDGIAINSSGNINIINNNISNSLSGSGIDYHGSGQLNAENNICKSNMHDGIKTTNYSDNNNRPVISLIRNVCDNNNENGISVSGYLRDGSVISENTCFNNNRSGIETNFCRIDHSNNICNNNDNLLNNLVMGLCFNGNMDVLEHSVNSLELSVFTSNALKRLNIGTLGELIQITKDDLLNEYNFESKYVYELIDVLNDMGLTLGMKINENINADYEHTIL